jgi:hypothetical protein
MCPDAISRVHNPSVGVQIPRLKVSAGQTAPNAASPKASDMRPSRTYAYGLRVAETAGSLERNSASLSARAQSAAATSLRLASQARSNGAPKLLPDILWAVVSLTPVDATAAKPGETQQA